MDVVGQGDLALLHMADGVLPPAEGPLTRPTGDPAPAVSSLRLGTGLVEALRAPDTIRTCVFAHASDAPGDGTSGATPRPLFGPCPTRQPVRTVPEQGRNVLVPGP